MSTIENGVSKAVDVSVVPNPHAEAAQQRVNELRQMRELIPHFTVPASTKETARLHSAASVSPEFVELTAMAVANENALVRGNAPTPAEVRDLMSYADAYSPFADELEALAQFVRHSVTAARNRAGTDALTTYSLARRLAKLPENAGLATYVADMRRALGRGRKASPEAIAKKAAETAARAAEKAAKAAAKAVRTPAKPAPAVPPTQQPS
ncbi:MAG TPA: hypothetical protein VGQ36_18890 [Thermoanaerobaculia bacterium]|jgi:hypothetical protein|nr:hypothetical protein [Thermoanaerobaculia bacterium]